MLIARTPEIDLDKADIVWSRIPEFALFFNATGAAIPNVEHFLNNVINEVRREVAERDPAFAETLALFIRQESNHTAYHNRFNKRLFAAGYGDLKPVLRQIGSELGEMRARRSLAFCAAYCAGFENAATYSAGYLLDSCADLFEGAEPNGANLLLWHVAEEFEHRSVCHDAFHAVSGSYFLRIWGLVYAFWHINYSFARCRRVILAKFREGMTPSERKASEQRHRKVLRRQALYMLPRMLVLFSPFFHPGKLRPSPRVEGALALFAQSAPILRTHYQDLEASGARR
jgi:predicted metal-dependent hydrolase